MRKLWLLGGLNEMGLAHFCATTTFGCLTLRGFRRVSTTDDGIRRLFLPSARFARNHPGLPSTAGARSSPVLA